MKRYDVVVVGARCAGSPLATLLAQRGFSVCLLDRAQFPSETPSTHLMQPSGVRMLDRLGVLESILGAGAVELDQLTMVIDDSVRIDTTLDPAIFSYPALCVRRITLDALLIEAAGASGADVRTGVRVTGLITDGGRITGVRTSSGEMIEAQIVVGADGCHSTIASLVGARDYHVTSPGRMFAWAYFDGVTDREGRVRIGRRADKGFLAAPTDGGLYMAAVMSDLSQRDGFRADRETHFASGLQGWPELHDVIGRGRRVGPIRAVSKWRGYFRQAAGPGWVLVGDAGHFKDPSPGQGIGDAFRQADHLASAVEDGMANTDPDSEIQRWWRWRDDDAHEMYGFAEDMGRPGASSPLLAQLMRDLSDNVDATQQFLHVLNHDVRPSQLLTPSRAARAAARTLRAKPTRMMSTTSEIVALARQEARRARRKRTFPPGMTGTV